MNELVQNIAGRVGISQDQAQKAVDIVIAYLKEKLPGSISSQLDNVMQGGAAAEAVKGLGSKLGL